MRLSQTTKFLIMADLRLLPQSPTIDPQLTYSQPESLYLAEANAARESFGFSPYPTPPLSPTYPRSVDGSPDNSNAPSPSSSTGKFALPFVRRRLFQESAKPLVPSTPNSPTPMGRQITVTKTSPVFIPQPDSNSELNLLPLTHRRTGIKFGLQLAPETSKLSLVVLEYVLTTPFVQYPLTMHNVARWCEYASLSGEIRGLGNPVKLGKMRAKTVILKIHAPSSGTAIKVNQMLSSMNFVEISPSVTFYVGWTVTQSEWKSKDLLVPYVPPTFGSARTFLRADVTQT